MKVVADVLDALEMITGGRVIKSLADLTSTEKPIVIMKTTGIPGKQLMETPALVY
jgi:hypothetical protein